MGAHNFTGSYHAALQKVTAVDEARIELGARVTVQKPYSFKCHPIMHQRHFLRYIFNLFSAIWVPLSARIYPAPCNMFGLALFAIVMIGVVGLFWATTRFATWRTSAS